MPSCRITNLTSKPLNICLKQVTALHFENSVDPGQTVKFKAGKVWFTLEALVDDETKKTRYSVLKSAATIALLSIAVAAVAATAGAALLPEAATAGAVGVGAYLAKGMTLTKTALIKNSGAVAKLSSVALPKAIDRLSAEFGGLTALQREVASIIASPSLSSDVRHKAGSLLRQVHTAYATDKAAKTASNSSTIDPAQPSANIVPLTDAQAKELEQEVEEGKIDQTVEDRPIMEEEVLRVHGLYMNERRELQIRTGENGRLELWDAKTGERW